MDDVRLLHLGQQNQIRSPPKWHGVLVSNTVLLIGSDPGSLAFLYAIVNHGLVTTSETELKTMPFLDQVQLLVPPNRASVFMCVILSSQPARSSTMSNFVHPMYHCDKAIVGFILGWPRRSSEPGFEPRWVRAAGWMLSPFSVLAKCLDRAHYL